MRTIYFWIGFITIIGGFSCANITQSPVSIVNPRCEYLTDPLGIDAEQPRLSWELISRERNQVQTAYQIVVASDSGFLSPGKADLWDSGKIKSDQTNQIKYNGQALQSRLFCYWKVRIWDVQGRASDWSAVSFWSMGLMNKSDWQAKWIGAALENVPKEQQCYLNYGYCSSTASSADENKWVQVDLGKDYEITEVRLYPVQPLKETGSQEMISDEDEKAKAYLFPPRFRVDVSTEKDFRAFKTVATESGKDYTPDKVKPYIKRFNPEKARYVRLNVSKLAQIDSAKYAFALAELGVFGNQEGNLALNKQVEVSAIFPKNHPLAREDWSAEVLVDGFLKAQPDLPEKLPIPPSPLLRKEFTIDKKVERSILYISALGLYEVRINGEKVGDHVLAPEWTDYFNRVQYQSYDVTSMLREGKNTIGAILADGWYAGSICGFPYRGCFGFDRRLLGQLEIHYADGSNHSVITDESWTISEGGPIRQASIWDGELYDANLQQKGWDKSGYDDSSWENVTVDRSIHKRLSAQMNEAIQVIEERKPITVFEKNGAYIFDVGQNLAGWVELSIPYNPLRKVKFRYGEVLNEDSTLFTLNLGMAEQTDAYIPSGEDKVLYEPRFTYHGFRYVEISGLTKPPSLTDITVKVVASASPPTGSFEASNADINKLWQNILWTQRSNMHSIPTDCPQRGERGGWMGDAQVFSQTAIFNMDMAAFYTKWNRDIRDVQLEDGRFPDYAPQVGLCNFNSPGWADAGVIIPWKMYLNYGDKTVLEKQYDAMTKFIAHILELNPDLVWRKSRGLMYGDWLNGNTIKSEGYPTTGGKVPDDIYSTTFFAYSTGIVSRIAEVLNKKEDAVYYGTLAEAIRQAFIKEFISDDGRITGNTQAGYALALEFGLVPEELKAKAAAHMVEAVKAYDYRISTGIQSTIRLMNQLSATGYTDIAYRLLESHRFPSWLYSIDQGATTIWERWDGYVKGRGFNTSGMNSFNHYAIGAVGEWMYRNILGINIHEDFPGYSHFTINPVPGGSLTWAKGTYHSIAGDIGVSWEKNEAVFSLDVEVPVNVTADVCLPSGDIKKIAESGDPVKGNRAFELINSSDGQTILKVGSGKYSFEILLN
jgi:alpha-L-rhamnosidase